MQIFVDLTCGVLGAILLAVVYYGFEFQWPGTYRNLADTFGLKVTQRLWRLISFRAGPVFLAGILIWTIAHRVKGSGWLAVIVMVALHILSSNGRAFVKSFIPGRPEAAINYGSYHLVAAFVAAAAGVASSLVAPFARDYVPSRESLVDGFWTALLVATAAGFVLRMVGTDAPDRNPDSVSYWVDRAVRDASIDAFDMLFSTASTARADPLLVKAFAIAEILQRPAWFRHGERLLGLLRGSGTYGIMQVAADRPIGDEESVRRFCTEIADKYFFEVSEDGYGSALSNEIWAVAGRHNGDRHFHDTVDRLYGSFLYEVNWVQLDEDSKNVGILELRRYATEWGIRVITTCEQVDISSNSWGHFDSASRPQGLPQDAWWTFESRCPIEVQNVQVYETGRKSAPVIPLQVRG